MRSEYLSFNIRGLPMIKRMGHNTRKGAPKNHVYKVTINDNVYYTVRLHRSGVQVSKYFKKKSDARKFVEFLAETKTWV